MDFTDINSWIKIAALLAVPLAIIGIWAQLKRRRMILTITEFEPIQLVSVKSEVEGLIEIFYDKNPIKDIQALNYTFTNTGVGSITNPEGFTEQHPIHVELNDDVIILQSTISNPNPDTPNIDCKAVGNKVVVSKVMLQKKDYFSLSIIASNVKSLKEHPATCRIKDVEVEYVSGFASAVKDVAGAVAGGVAVAVVVVLAGVAGGVAVAGFANASAVAVVAVAVFAVAVRTFYRAE